MEKFLVAVTLIVLAASSPGCGKKTANKGQPPGNGVEKKEKQALAKPRDDIAGLPNFSKVSDQLYRGAQPAAEGFSKLKKMGIRTIVNLRTVNSDRELMSGLGLKYAHISFKPWHPEEEDIIAFLQIVTDPENQPVFVHCQHGADRTGTMVAIYRIAIQGWGVEKAMEELPLFGFHKIWDNLKDYLLEMKVETIKKSATSAKYEQIEIIP